MQRGFSVILVLLGVLIVVGSLIGIVYYFGVQKQNPNPKITPDLANAPLNTKESIDYHFKPFPYSQLTGSILESQLKTFTDSGLNISFKYSKAYSIYSINSDSKHKIASVFLLKNVTPEKEQAIQDEIYCDTDNRRNPSGVCSEGLLSDVDITVVKVDKYPSYDEDKNYDWRVCQKEIDTKEKVIYSCREQVDAGRFGYKYYVYLDPFTEPVVLQLATLDASDSADVIKSVIDSFSGN